MGVFDFIRSAGRILVAGPAGAAAAAVQDASKPAPPAPSAESIKAELKRVGLPADDIEVKVDGDTVHIKGAADNAAIKEKLILASGNVAGIGKVKEEIDTKDGGDEPVFHTVQKGDTLSKIAQQHYGAASKYPVIFDANKPMLTDPNKIYPGQALRIPKQ